MRYLIILLVFLSCKGQNKAEIKIKEVNKIDSKINWESDKGICFSEEKINGGGINSNYVSCDCNCTIEENRVFFPKDNQSFFVLNSTSKVIELNRIKDYNNFYDAICEKDLDLSLAFNIGNKKYLSLCKTPQNCYELCEDKPSVEELSIEKQICKKEITLYNEVFDDNINTDFYFFLNKSKSDKIFNKSNDLIKIGDLFYILNAIKDKNDIVWIQVLYGNMVKWVREDQTNIKVIWS